MSLILLNTSNNTLHTDLHIPFVREVAKQLKIPQDYNHFNPLISNLSSNCLLDNTTRRFNQIWLRDFLVDKQAGPRAPIKKLSRGDEILIYQFIYK